MSAEYDAQIKSIEESLIRRLKPLEMWRPESMSRIEILEGLIMNLQTTVVALGAKLDSMYPAIESIQDVPGRVDEVEARVKGFGMQLKEVTG